MSNYQNQVEVISFVRGGQSANIVTDGERTKSFEWQHVQDHSSLKQAISYLEAKGYKILTDGWEDMSRPTVEVLRSMGEHPSRN